MLKNSKILKEICPWPGCKCQTFEIIEFFLSIEVGNFGFIEHYSVSWGSGGGGGGWGGVGGGVGVASIYIYIHMYMYMYMHMYIHICVRECIYIYIASIHIVVWICSGNIDMVEGSFMKASTP